MLDFGQKPKNDQPFREEMRILATQIETINQQLASGAGGSGPALTKAFSDVNQRLTYLYEFLKTMQSDLRQDTKAQMDQVQGSVNATLKKNLGDMYAIQQETNKAIGNIKTSSSTVNQQDISDIKTTLRELISVYKEEVDLFRKQNEFLQKKLIDIEVRLGELEK